MRKQSIVVLGAATVMILASLVIIGIRQNRATAPADPHAGHDHAGATNAADADGVPTLEFIRDPQRVADLTMVDLDGNRITTAGLEGKVTMLNFWATWCPPCREEIPDFVALHERYADQLQIIGISMDEGSVDDVRAFAAEYGINYPIVMFTPEINEEFPGVFALPTTFVLNPDAQTVQKHVGLVNPFVYELATRAMTDLPVDVDVAYVEDTGQVTLANAAHATEIPGLDMSHLTPEQRESALQRLNEESCTCGCNLTVAQCRINDSTCGVSPGIAQRIVDEESQL